MGLIAAAFIGLGAVAVTGWIRKPASNLEPVAYSAPAPATENTATPASPVSYDQYGQPLRADMQSEYVHTAPYTHAPPPAYKSYGATTTATGPAYDSPPPLPAYGSHRYVRVVRPRPVEYADRHEDEHHHHRSTGKSVAIVAGSAGVGAAIGGIAGGGKGAGIGALAGGAGGFIYDRLTHNH
jgi:hypothetical protein